MKQASQEIEEKITALTGQGTEEIIEIEVVIVKEVEVAKEDSQKFIQRWRSVQHA